MKKTDIKEVLLQVIELQLDYHLRAIRQLQGKPETEPVISHRIGIRVVNSIQFRGQYT